MNKTQKDILEGLKVDGKSLELFNKYNDLIGDDVKKLVINADNKPITTQNNYGNYLPIVTSLIEGGMQKSLIGLLLVFQGGNKMGIASCIRILNR